LDEQAQGGRIFDGDLVNVAPSKLWEERFWIHAPAFATASAHEQTCFIPFWLTPVAPEKVSDGNRDTNGQL
jgi:hypothetical protein